MQWGQVNGLECACGYNKTFFVKSDRIVCSNCGRERACSPPIVDVIKAECACKHEVTFVVDTEENYICTNCGRRR